MIGNHPEAEDKQARIAALQASVRACRLCEERGFIPVARPITEGRPSDRIMVIGQAPGHVSVEHGRPFSGTAGRMLDGWLERAGFPAGALYDRVYLSAVTKCDPGKNPRGGGDRRPSPAEMALCRPFLDAELAILQPAVILLVGTLAIASFLGDLRLDAAVGHTFTARDVVLRPLWPGHTEARLLPLPHSSGVSRWLNDAQHRELLAQALAYLDRWRQELSL